MYLFSAGACVVGIFFFLGGGGFHILLFFPADTLDFILSILALPQILHKISMPVSEGCQHLDMKACVCRIVCVWGEWCDGEEGGC